MLPWILKIIFNIYIIMYVEYVLYVLMNQYILKGVIYVSQTIRSISD